MKMTSLAFIICMFCASLTAPPSPIMVIIQPEAIRPYEGVWTATCKVETNFDPYAIGDKHLRHKSYGISQIRKTRLDDYFQRTGIRYSVEDMFDPVKSKEVFMYYCSGNDMECISRCWNGGARGMEKKTTIKYWKLIQKQLDKL